jgi:hypothetical protein
MKRFLLLFGLALAGCAKDPPAPIEAYRARSAEINITHTQRYLMERRPPPKYPHYWD